MKDSDKKDLQVLEPNNYAIPNGYKAFIKSGVIYIKAKKKRAGVFEKKYDRCRDCALFSIGRSGRMARFDRYVCLAKAIDGENLYTLNKLYEGVKEFDRACSLFVKKDR